MRQTWFDEEWLGCKLDEDRIERLKTLNDKYGIDLYREKEEYHTMVIDEAELEEEKLVIDMEEIAVNVNRREDLKIAERLFKRLFRRSPSDQ